MTKCPAAEVCKPEHTVLECLEASDEDIVGRGSSLSPSPFRDVVPGFYKLDIKSSSEFV